MTKTGQVFPIMSGITTGEQIKILFRNVQKYLKDKKLGEIHLNTDFSRSSFKISGGIPQNAGKTKNTISITSNFADKWIEVRFVNPNRKNFGNYLISKVTFNGKIVAKNINQPNFLIARSDFLSLSHNNINLIEITLN